MDRDRVVKVILGCSELPPDVSSDMEMLKLLNEGLPADTLATIEKLGIIDGAELKSFIPARTLSRRRGAKQRLSIEESDLIARLARTHEFAVEVFGDKEKAKRWLRTANRAIEGRLPLDLLRTDYGARIVDSLLGRIAYGIYS